jgi:hypothetical protein
MELRGDCSGCRYGPTVGRALRGPMNTQPFYLDLEQARAVLAEIGIAFSERQMKRAAEPDVDGHRKLPFFVDPIDGRLKIERQTLIDTYRNRQVMAERNVTPTPRRPTRGP